MPAPDRRLATLEAFTLVANRLSFVAAADELGISASALSRRIALLEDGLGIRLFRRTTRQVTVTEAGSVYLRYVSDALSHIADGQAAISDLQTEPRGRLRVALPNLFGQSWVAPRLPEFMDRFPGLELDIALNDRYVDLIAEGFDLAVRFGILQSSRLVARRLGTSHRVLCASPDYVERFGEPESAQALVDHTCLHFKSFDGQMHWQLESAGNSLSVPVSPSVVADNAEAIRQMTLAGSGISLLASFMVANDLQTGRLVRILPEWAGPETPIWAIYPDARFLPRKVRVFRDFLVTAFRQATHGP